MRDYFTLLAKSVQFKTTNYAKCDLGLCFVDTNNNPTFDLLNLSQISGAHVNFLLRLHSNEKGKNLHSYVFLNYRNQPPPLPWLNPKEIDLQTYLDGITFALSTNIQRRLFCAQKHKLLAPSVSILLG